MSIFIPNEINLFSTPPTAMVFKSYYDEELTPLNPIDMSSGVEFHSPGYSHICKSFTDIYIHFQAQLIKDDDKLYTSVDKFQPRFINNIGSSIFKSARIYLNNVLAYSIDNLHHYKAIFEASFNTNVVSASSQYSSCGLFPHELYSKLTNLSLNSKSFDIYSRLNLINVPQLLLPNVSVTIRLEFNTMESFIFENTYDDNSTKKSTKSKAKISEMKVYMRHYDLHETIDKQIEINLAGRHANYQFKAAKMTYFTIPANQSNVHLGNVYSGITPEFIACAFVPNTSFTGDRNSDTFEFNHFNTSDFCFLINGNRFPRIPYKFDFSEEKTSYARAFSNLYSSIKLRGNNKSSLISRENYLKNFIIVEDVTTGQHALTNLNSVVEHASVGVSINFHKALEKSITVILYMLIPSKISISKTREVMVHY